MDKASVYGTGDCRFESYQDHFLVTYIVNRNRNRELIWFARNIKLLVEKSSKADLNRHRWIQSPEC